eukprot:TRINITY_DN1942_c0_g1_i1.p2 TRINITY_DN1942_c0_g1~~TRINITY_DN1942_c0_g1_i1.p2  ORF type:complete len:176 (+),score=32.32 TRINITY_DN1942_c0_g1_i1:125-652(+)
MGVAIVPIFVLVLTLSMTTYAIQPTCTNRGGWAFEVNNNVGGSSYILGISQNTFEMYANYAFGGEKVSGTVYRLGADGNSYNTDSTTDYLSVWVIVIGNTLSRHTFLLSFIPAEQRFDPTYQTICYEIPPLGGEGMERPCTVAPSPNSDSVTCDDLVDGTDFSFTVTAIPATVVY